MSINPILPEAAARNRSGSRSAGHWFLVAVGLVFIATGMLLNEWLLAHLFSPDGILSPVSRSIIWGFDVSCVTLGLLGIFFRDRMTQHLSRFFLHDHPNFAALAAGLGVAAFVLTAVEALFFVMNTYGRDPAELSRHYTPGFFAPDPILGFSPEPDAQYTTTAKFGEERIFRATYTVDANRCRVVPSEGSVVASRFLLFCGGSFAFGTGVQDDETLPFYVVEGAPDYRGYNLAFVGYGPQHTLAILEQEENLEQVRERQGILIYVFIPDHVIRANGTMHRMRDAATRRGPTFIFDEEDTPNYSGPFYRAHPWRTRFYDLLAHEQVFRYLNADFPPAATDRHIGYAAKLLKASEERFLQRFEGSEFYVLLHPLLEEAGGIQYADVLRIFRAEGLKVLDYSRMFGTDKGRYFYPYDQHPTRESHRSVAKRLISDLNLASRTE